MKYRFLILLLTLPLLTFAQPMSLDLSFGLNGAAINQTDGWGKEAYNMIRQPDGKLVVAGVEWSKPGMTIQQSIITRFLPGGQLDNSFGTNGSVRIITGNDNGAQALALQADGKIVVAGSETIIQPGPSVEIISKPFIARFNANGTSDNSFGTNGVQRLDMLDAHFLNKDLAAIAVLPDGKIIAGGTGATATEIKMFMIRLNANGSYDNSFATSGLGQYVIESGSATGLWDMAVQNDGKIVMAGTTAHSSLPTIDDRSFALVRIYADGMLDLGFGTQGTVATRLSEAPVLNIEDIAHRVILQPDGKICLAGTAKSKLAMARYMPDGSLDPSFGQGGKIAYPMHPAATGITLLNGKLYTCGTVPAADYSSDISISAFNADGSTDNTFAPNGMLTAHFYKSNYTHALLAQPDGKLVTAGAFSKEGLGESGFMLTRFRPGTPTGITPKHEQQVTLTLFPNPASDLLTLTIANTVNTPEGHIDMISASGQVVYSGALAGTHTTLQVSHLADGIYALRINIGEEVQTLKFVKQSR